MLVGQVERKREKKQKLCTSRLLHGPQYHLYFLSFDLLNALVFLPSVPQPEHFPRLAASCEKEHRGAGIGVRLCQNKDHEILRFGIDARDEPVVCSKPGRPVSPHRPC